MSKTDQEKDGPVLRQGRWRSREELQPMAEKVAADAALMNQLRAAIGSNDSDRMRNIIYQITEFLQKLDAAAGGWEGARVTLMLAEKLDHASRGGKDDRQD